MVQGRVWGARQEERRCSVEVLHHRPKPGLGLGPQSRGFPTQGRSEPPGVLLVKHTASTGSVSIQQVLWTKCLCPLKIRVLGASLVVQQLRICLPMQGTWV